MSYATLARQDAVVSAQRAKAATSAVSSGLRIGEPNDTYEREADRVAEEVLAEGHSRHQWSLSDMNLNPTLRRKCSCTASGGSGGKCEQCNDESKGKMLAVGAAVSNVAPPIVNEVLNSPGQPLDRATRDFFEPRFGHDLSRVQIHTDLRAAQSAQSVQAAAYSVGGDLVFADRMFAPHRPEGRRLMAHELTHVLQQGAADPVPKWQESTASHRIEKGERASVTLAAPMTMQRQALSGSGPETDLAESASPLLAAAIGSVSLDGFVTGKADVSGDNQARLAHTVDTIMKLLRQYPASTIRVIGHTDAVGQESNNQALGQARADSVQAALLETGIPGVSVHTESRGASDPVLRTTKSEPRNRRVDVRFEPSRLLRGAMSQGLTLTPSVTQPTQPADAGKGGIPGFGDLCIKNPTLCYGKGQEGPDGPPTVPKGALQPIPDNTPFNLMDVQGANEPYTSHGRGSQEGGDLRAIWAAMFWKYRVGLSEDLAAKAANSELSSTAGKDQSRDNPNAADRLDSDIQRANPNATKLGPANYTLFRF